jgi:2,4-dienoyl-CoA reductase-like NADH-dependent reductase (Old Yellow Enzyme family)
MGMQNPIPTFSHLVSQLRARHPDMAYLHVVDVRVDDTKKDASVTPSINFLRQLWYPKPFIVAGDFTPELALAHAQEHPSDLVAFGRWFISNASRSSYSHNRKESSPHHTARSTSAHFQGHSINPLRSKNILQSRKRVWLHRLPICG